MLCYYCRSATHQVDGYNRMTCARGNCLEAHGYFGMVLPLPCGFRFPSSGVLVLACRAVQVHAMNDGKHTFALTHLLVLSSACKVHKMLC